MASADVAASGGLKKITELTIRGLILGVLITLVFTAANVYLGLKVGLTFATSIPAAVISMAVLSWFRNASILENNIVQTVASAAGTLAAIIFVLPGLLIVGWWTGFPFWQSFAICAVGGILGVLFTIPLRRAMVTTSDLPYPEGVAAAEVLEVGSRAREATGASANPEVREGLVAVVYGTIASAALAILIATRVAAGNVADFFRFNNGAVTGYDLGFSLALLGAGYLVGISVGMAMLLGLVIAWGGAVPILTMLTPAPEGVDFATHAQGLWRADVRFIGAGTIAVAAVWSLLKLAKPVISGVISTMRASKAKAAGTHDRRDTDMSLGWVLLITVACLAVIAWLLSEFLHASPLASNAGTLILVALPFVVIGGFLISAICGYMAGLIGASNSPISGVGILAILSCSLILIVVINPGMETQDALIAYALFITAIVFAIACIANNNLQDLKTGQLVGATPAAQQWALIVGCVAGAAVIPPVLNLLAEGFGFVGAPGSETATQPLGAPQANLISALAKGVITRDLNWDMLGVGAILGVVLIIIDELLRLKKWLRLPPLAVGIAIYLPMATTLPVVVGAIIGNWYDNRAKRKKDPEHAKRLGTLVASGMIVGESLFGVLLAGLIVWSGSDAPMGLVPADYPYATWIGLGAFGALIVLLYGWMLSRSR
jgi:putative OPT family oligopeptide transporter